MCLVDLHVPSSWWSLELNPDQQSLAATQAKRTAVTCTTGAGSENSQTWQDLVDVTRLEWEGESNNQYNNHRYNNHSKNIRKQASKPRAGRGRSYILSSSDSTEEIMLRETGSTKSNTLSWLTTLQTHNKHTSFLLYYTTPCPLQECIKLVTYKPNAMD